MPDKGTLNANLLIRMLCKKMLDIKHEINCGFVD